MATSLLIQNETIARRLLEIAQAKNQSVEAFLEGVIAEYSSTVPPTSDAVKAEHEVNHRLYAQARKYWESVGDQARATLSDQELDEQFWLIDHEGIPRLKSEQGQVQVEDHSLLTLVEVAEQAAFTSWRTDLSEHTRELLGEVLAHHHESGHGK